ncbi:MAG: DUF2380 domain-containing protein [Phyllobacterium sp.]|uniref:DUF2380 domain-containing protein n=1 Tax=Phyllobacterium sp. TaxID=1871046 RepID=UPI0030F29E2B
MHATAHISLALCCSLLTSGDGRAETPAVIASANFDFIDTSGEPRDQSADHQRRLTDLSDYLREQLAEQGKFKLVPLPCQASQCTATDPGYEALSAMARQNGAAFVVIGAVQKTSTLIGWLRYSVLDVRDSRAVCGEFITYRGDTDEAWRRAARFSAGQIIRHCGLNLKN